MSLAVQRLLVLWSAGLMLLTAGCASLPVSGARQPSFATADGARTALGRLTAACGSGSPHRQSGFRLLPEAAFALEARLALIRHAEKSLDVQYYLIQKDEVGLLVLRELRDAAARGVRVRLLVDDFYTAGEDDLFSSLAAFPNIEVRLFNPLPSRAQSFYARLMLSLHEFARINHRMHNKQLVADDSFAVSGGRNIASEYFMQSAEANFIDMDVLSSGPIVHQMSSAFDVYWNSAQVRPIDEVVSMASSKESAQRRFDYLVAAVLPPVTPSRKDVLGRTALGEQLALGKVDRICGSATLYFDKPTKIGLAPEAAFHGSVTEGALNVFSSAREGIHITSPYFIPSTRGMEIMRRAMQRGGRISIVTNSLGSTDEPMAYAAYARRRAEMLRFGVQIQEIGPVISGHSGRYGKFGKSVSQLHAKMAVIDHDRIFIGSMNLDHRSADVNTETALLIESAELVADLQRLFAGPRTNDYFRLRLNPSSGNVQWIEQNANGGDVVHEDEPGGHMWLRLKNLLLLPWVGEDLL